MELRKGKTKSILESSRDAALLAVEIYNKPRTAFRSQAYITLMVTAWTTLFHAHFNKTIGDRYYYKDSRGRFKIVDGERKAWELRTCLSKYAGLSEPVRANLLFFIGLRNKIEHRYVSREEIDEKIFGECQSLLYNYEKEIAKLFGEQYAINESLAFSLQFSSLRTEEQRLSIRTSLSREMQEIKKYIDTYRGQLSDSIYSSQEYSIKLIQIPKVATASRSDLAVEFIRWEELSEEEKKVASKLTAIVKEKTVTKYKYNPKCYKPGSVVDLVNERISDSGKTIHHGDHRALQKVFKIRPFENEPSDPFETKEEYCLYDGVHGDYVFTENWVDLIARLINNYRWIRATWRGKYKRGQQDDPNRYS